MIAPSQRAAPNDPRQPPRATHPQATAAASPAAPLHTDHAHAAAEAFPSTAPADWSAGRAAQTSTTSKTSKAASMAQRLIGEYPVVAVCTAAALGAALGWLVKRRR